MTKKLTHIEADGNPKMVDVSGKNDSFRTARAHGKICLQPGTIELIEKNRIAKGNVLVTAKIAGIQAAKKTAELIPLCHVLPLTKVDLHLHIRAGGVEVESEAKYTGKTGVEMEALTAVVTALLTIYDMCKAVDNTMTISDIKLIEKKKQEI